MLCTNYEIGTCGGGERREGGREGGRGGRKGREGGREERGEGETCIKDHMIIT